jgi:hypothetical protein
VQEPIKGSDSATTAAQSRLFFVTVAQQKFKIQTQQYSMRRVSFFYCD